MSLSPHVLYVVFRRMRQPVVQTALMINMMPKLESTTATYRMEARSVDTEFDCFDCRPATRRYDQKLNNASTAVDPKVVEALASSRFCRAVLATHWLRFGIYTVLLIDDAPAGGGSATRDRSQVGDVREAPSPNKQTNLTDPLRPATRFSPCRQSWRPSIIIMHMNSATNMCPIYPAFDRFLSDTTTTGHESSFWLHAATYRLSPRYQCNCVRHLCRRHVLALMSATSVGLLGKHVVFCS
jgi:hypothetical protein